VGGATPGRMARPLIAATKTAACRRRLAAAAIAVWRRGRKAGEEGVQAQLLLSFGLVRATWRRACWRRLGPSSA